MLILLIGPKGSGKSHIGRVLEARLGVHFFHVEPLWMAFHAECAHAGRPVEFPAGISRVHPRIAEALASHQNVCVETTGASREILEDLMRLADAHGLLRVKVQAPLAVCLERIRTRSQKHQIPMQEDLIRCVYELAAALELPFERVIDNDDLSDDEIVECLGPLLAASKDGGQP